MIALGPEIGKVIDDQYELVRAIGAGSMGVVYEARHLLTGQRVALKWLKADLARDPERSARFEREAQAALLAQHPNVVEVYDVGNDGGALYLVMEYLEGRPFSEWLAQAQEPLHEVLAVLVEAMRGVCALHAAGVIHRDLKPDNIFLVQEADGLRPIPKLIDFGISKLELEGREQLAWTLSGSTLGTPAYMSYEQLVSAKDVDARTDVYSCGVILYEAITGTLPFQGASFGELALQIATREPVAPKRLRPDIPTALDRLVLWAMARDREQRVPSMEQLVLELEAFTTAHSFHAQLTVPTVVVPETQRSLATRRVLALLALALLLCLGLAATRV